MEYRFNYKNDYNMYLVYQNPLFSSIINIIQIYIMNVFQGFYTKMVDGIIRPPRQTYNLGNLGENEFTYNGFSFLRQDFTLENYRNQKIQCSYFKKTNCDHIRPLIIYLHGNSSSRYTSTNNTRIFLKYFDVCLFDFTGSGISEGNYVTVGYHQKEDLKTVIKYLKHVKKIPVIFLWGRSMGSVVSILYTGKYGNIQELAVDGVVADSPFYDFEVLLYQIAQNNYHLPKFLIKYFISGIQERLLEKIKKEYNFEFQISKFKPIQQMKKIKVPVYILSGQNDDVIQYHHSKQLYANCKAEKKHLFLFKGDHNSNRPIDITQEILYTLKGIGANKIIEFERQEEQKRKLQQNLQKQLKKQNPISEHIPYQYQLSEIEINQDNKLLIFKNYNS